MNEKPICMGHMNGFEHFAGQLSGLDEQFDLGIKFEERESDEYSIDPITGVKVWPEPFLALYVSVKQVDLGDLPPLTLHYGLTRSKFSAGLTSNQMDRHRLLDLALPELRSDLNLLDHGEEPFSLSKTRLL